MNISQFFSNNTLSLSTTTTTTVTMKTIKKYYVKNPFDSWYIGGLLFMLTVILVLLYANFYRENTCQILWIQFLTKLRLLPPATTSSIRSSTHHTIDPLLI